MDISSAAATSVSGLKTLGIAGWSLDRNKGVYWVHGCGIHQKNEFYQKSSIQYKCWREGWAYKSHAYW